MDDRKDVERLDLSAFVSTVAHDLRAPLSSIQLSAQLIMQELSEGSNINCLKERIEIIDRQTTSMIRMISTFLDADKIASGKFPLSKKRNNAGKDVIESVQEFDSLARSRNIILQADIENFNIYGLYDKDRIRQVLINLISNALRFATEGTICKVGVKAESYNRIQFEVYNVGDKIPDSEREIIFQRYVSGQASNGSSNGLGLWISRWIINEHGGKIWVDAKECGNVFCFSLPRHFDTEPM